VLPAKTTPAYDSILVNDPSQRSAIEKQFILGTNYSITYNNQQANRVHSFYINGDVDISGNLAGLLVPRNDTGQKTIFGNSFAQYERFTLEGRHYWRLGKGKQWVNRLLMGYGLPYGNSTTLPFVKQFFTGGSSSIRAFRARTLGPGSYHNPAVDSSALLANEAGDIKLEFNSEVRLHIASVFNFAAFIDAGNIWLQKDVPEKPGSKFNFNTFYKEIAVGGGVGLRIDASIVVVRLDLAMPLRVPYLPENERWVINKINFGDPEWRKKNLVLNIAIGYPF
jgi:outer membrane protein assembly factor BamA